MTSPKELQALLEQLQTQIQHKREEILKLVILKSRRDKRGLPSKPVLQVRANGQNGEETPVNGTVGRTKETCKENIANENATKSTKKPKAVATGVQKKGKSSHFTKCIRQNIAKYNYKNRIVIEGLRYVVAEGGTELVLVSTDDPKTGKTLASIDDMALWIPYKGKKYVKTFTGKYVVQALDGKPPERHPEDCVRFTRHGFCKTRGCSGLHLANHVALCPSVLAQRPCTHKKCSLSHQPSQFNTPSCRFFQTGSCTNPDCLYSHKLEPREQDTICRQFAYNGFCEKGRKCPLLHSQDCPDMKEYGFCHKGKGCKLNHRIVGARAFTSSVPSRPIRNEDNDDVVVYFEDSTMKVADSSEEETRLDQNDSGTQFTTNSDYVEL